MKEELKQIYQEENDVFGYKQTYKGIDFYPILVKDLEYIRLFNVIFTFPKMADTSSKRVFKMSYLKYMTQEKNVPEEFFDKFFKYITKREDVELERWKHSKEKLNTLDDVDNTIMDLKIGDVIFSEEEFDNLREIILEQNGSDIDYINEFRLDLEEVLKWTQKEFPLTFNDQISTIASLYRSFPKAIGELTLWQLNDLFDRRVIEKQFDTYAPLLASGQVTMKSGKLQSYLYHKEKKGRYDSVLMSAESFDKIESGLTDKNSI
jgi:hypothetical protein